MSEHDPRIPSSAELSQLAIGRFENSMRLIMADPGPLRHRGALMLRAYADLLESCVPSEQLMTRMDGVLDSLKPVIGGGSPQPKRHCNHCSRAIAKAVAELHDGIAGRIWTDSAMTRALAALERVHKCSDPVCCSSCAEQDGA